MDSQNNVIHPEIFYDCSHIFVKKENEEFSLCCENESAILLFSSFDFTKQKKAPDFFPKNSVCSGIVMMDFNEKVISGFTINSFLLGTDSLLFKKRKLLFEVVKNGCFEVYQTASEGDMETNVLSFIKEENFDIPDYLDTMICENYHEDERHDGYYNTIPKNWDSSSFYVLNHSPIENLEFFIKSLSSDNVESLLKWSKQAEHYNYRLMLSEEKKMIGMLNQYCNEVEIQKKIISSFIPNFKKRF